MKPLTVLTFSIVLMHGLCLLNATNSFAEEVAIAVTQDDPVKVRARVFAKCEVYGELEAIVHIAKRENLGKQEAESQVEKRVKYWQKNYKDPNLPIARLYPLIVDQSRKGNKLSLKQYSLHWRNSSRYKYAPYQRRVDQMLEKYFESVEEPPISGRPEVELTKIFGNFCKKDFLARLEMEPPNIVEFEGDYVVIE